MEVRINDMHFVDCVSVCTHNDTNSCDIQFSTPEQMQDFIHEACDNDVQTLPYGDVIVTAYYDYLECR